MKGRDVIPVVDLFAGPGGLGEGFAAVGRPGAPAAPVSFRVALSIERDTHAHRTLLIRSLFRHFPPDDIPVEYYQLLRGEVTLSHLMGQFPDQAEAARAEAIQLELGSDNHRSVRRLVRSAVDNRDRWVLVGGPPCQAYSIAGRSRNRSKKDYRPEEDHRHFLYAEFLRVVAEHSPPVFVLENVKGLLSATVEEAGIFNRIYEDLSDPVTAVKGRNGSSRPRYRIVPLSPTSPGQLNLLARDDPARFILRMERHGIPQARHRLILLGVRDDVTADIAPMHPITEPTPARAVLSGLPPLRSGLSRQTDSPEDWETVIFEVEDSPWFHSEHDEVPEWGRVQARIERVFDALHEGAPDADRGGRFVPADVTSCFAGEWYVDRRLGGACNHESRAHMASDLHRYLFAACYAAVHNRSPVLGEFPRAPFPQGLLPDHQNVEQALSSEGFFSDRFRVQVAREPATTVTSHISKDGHYYIHFDPAQCRSLTVREAARLQTFPDNYFFSGPRTSQYVQVGNAVPPLMAAQIAAAIAQILN